MKITADLHIHSRFSRACSKELNIPNLEKYARIKGLQLLGTGDFQHPKWFDELKSELTDNGKGVMMTKGGFPFILQTEVSLIYDQGGKSRRVHLVILAPNFEVAKQVQEYLKGKGRIDYDGRPIFKIPCYEIVEELRKISTDMEVIPAHIWTPWFSLFGSKSGFNSMKEAFKDQEKHVHAIETGLSSDPPMNWRIKELDNKAIISNSDAHSHWPWRLGREATVYEMDEMSYAELIKAIRQNKIVETIELYPEEGKYHFDGHRNCGECYSPKQSIAHGMICQKCTRPVTVGVASRVEYLAAREEGEPRFNSKPFRKLIPLHEVIARFRGGRVQSQKTWQEYNKLVKEFGNEFAVMSAPYEKLAKITDRKIAGAIANVTKVKWKPGYDGAYGIPLFEGASVQKDLKSF